MKFKRIQDISKNLYPKRVLVVYGPRRVGKTTLTKNYIESIIGKNTKYDVGDDLKLRELFNSENRKEILDYARPYDVVVIDEAQNISKIGIASKILIDEFPFKEIILTGSSSFDLSQTIGEPLTGRHFVLTLLPIAQAELEISNFERKNNLEDFLIFGSYPEILSTDNTEIKKKILFELVSSYLFKDILALDRLRSPEVLLNITKALALQIGSEVSLNEISRLVGVDVKTVGRYIEVLEKSFVIKKISAYSNNLRNEISKKSKYYFYDLGVRNAVISQFNKLSERNDTGMLWENFIFIELFKKFNLKEINSKFYFWRTKDKKEIDIIIDTGNKIEAFECKWSENFSKNIKYFNQKYPNSKVVVVNKDNYLDFLVS